MTLLLRDVEVRGAVVDVRVRDGAVAQVGRLTLGEGEDVVMAGGGALLPGLHDHHLHLLALAAARDSVDVSGGLEPLRRRSGDGWLRAVGWVDDGDRHDLDCVIQDRPVRVQHRSGALWVVNSAGVARLGLDGCNLPGVERGADGLPTGRLWRLDSWLGEQLGRESPDLRALGHELAALGLTGVTDATPDLDEATCALLAEHVPQRLLLLGAPTGSTPAKVVLADSDLPTLPALVDRLRSLRPRPVAVHCVTRVALVLLLAALDEVGGHPDDRVEHAGVVPPELRHGLPLCVTQPGMLAERGDDYLRDVAPSDRPHLYPYGDLLAHDVPVVPSSDAPYGPLDPWATLRAARDRTTRTGTRVPGRTVSVEVALDGMLRPLDRPTSPPRCIVPGVPADLLLLHVPLKAALADPSAELVRATWIGGSQLSGTFNATHW